MNMQGLTFPDCNTYLVPVGTGDCYAVDKQPKGLIFTTRDFTLDVNGTPDGWANAFEDINNTGKVQYIQDGIVNFEPSGGDLRLSQEGYGPSVVTGLNVYQEVYTVIEGGLCLYKNLLKLHGKRLKVFVIGEDNNVLMTYKEELSFAAPKITKAYFQGFDVNVGVTYRKNNGTNVGAVQITLIYTSYEKEFANASMFKLPRELKTWIGTYLTLITPPTAGTTLGTPAILKLRTLCGGVEVKLENSVLLTTQFTVSALHSTDKITAETVAVESNGDISVSFYELEAGQYVFTADLSKLNLDEGFRNTGYTAPDVYSVVIDVIQN